jgi:hypothetical protein
MNSRVETSLPYKETCILTSLDFLYRQARGSYISVCELFSLFSAAWLSQFQPLSYTGSYSQYWLMLLNQLAFSFHNLLPIDCYRINISANQKLVTLIMWPKYKTCKPIKKIDPEEIRTPNLPIWSRTLYRWATESGVVMMPSCSTEDWWRRFSTSLLLISIIINIIILFEPLVAFPFV